MGQQQQRPSSMCSSEKEEEDDDDDEVTQREENEDVTDVEADEKIVTAKGLGKKSISFAELNEYKNKVWI